jgi:hypothetical protein
MVSITLSAAGTKKAVSRLREFLASVGISLSRPMRTKLLLRLLVMRTGTLCKHSWIPRQCQRARRVHTPLL